MPDETQEVYDDDWDYGDRIKPPQRPRRRIAVTLRNVGKLKPRVRIEDDDEC